MPAKKLLQARKINVSNRAVSSMIDTELESYHAVL